MLTGNNPWLRFPLFKAATIGGTVFTLGWMFSEFIFPTFCQNLQKKTFLLSRVKTKKDNWMARTEKKGLQFVFILFLITRLSTQVINAT